MPEDRSPPFLCDGLNNSAAQIKLILLDLMDLLHFLENATDQSPDSDLRHIREQAKRLGRIVITDYSIHSRHVIRKAELYQPFNLDKLVLRSTLGGFVNIHRKVQTRYNAC